MPPTPLTHFLCIPLVTTSSRAHLQNALSTFRGSVTALRTPEMPHGIPEGAIRPLGTLHLTLGVMSLITPEKVEGALKLLKELDLSKLMLDTNPTNVYKGGVSREKNESSETQAIPSASETISSDIKPPPLTITLKGLLSMHAPSKTSILYSSPVDEDLRLISFCQKLRDIFTTADLVEKENRPLLLHATIVNTVYLPGQRGKGSGHGKKKPKMTIDSRELLMDYEDFIWMSDIRLEKIAICRMGQKRNEVGEQEYVVEGEVDLPC